MHGWRDHDLLRRGLEVFGLESLAEVAEAPAELEELARARLRGSRAEGLRDERPAARRDRGGGLGGARRRRPSPASSSCPSGDFASSSTGGGRCARRSAGRAQVLELWATERALKAEPWLRRGRRPAPRQAGARADRPRPARRTTRACSRGSSRSATPTRYELAAGEAPLLAVLDSVTDPRNLGAVIRSADGAGADGVVAARAQLGACHARGRARLGGRGRARAGRGGQEPRPLPRRDQGPAALDLGGGRRRGDLDVGGRPLGRRRLRARRGGQGPAAARAAHLRRRGLDPAAREGRVAERQRRRRAAALRGEAAALAEPTLYLFDGYNLLHAGRSTIRASSSTGSRASSRCSGARGVVVFDGVGEERVARPARGALRRARRRAAGAARRRAPRRARRSASSRPTRPSAARPGRRCRSAAREPSCRTSTSRGTRTRADRSSEIAWTKRRENV